MERNARNKKWIYLILLIMVVLIWGTAPNLSKYLLGYYSPAIKTALASVVAFVAMLLVCAKRLKKLNKEYFLVALPTGAFYSVAVILQQIGLNKTTPTMYAFLENLSCLVVPFLVWWITKNRPRIFQFIGAALCIISVYILGGGGGFDGFGVGDLLCGLAGVLYGVNIAVTGTKARKLDAGLYLLVQFGVHMIISTVYAFCFEDIVFSSELWAMGLLAGITLISTVFGWLIRTICLKHIDATLVSVIMPMASVVTALISVIVGSDKLTVFLVVGGILGVIAAVVSNFKPKSKNERGEEVALLEEKQVEISADDNKV